MDSHFLVLDGPAATPPSEGDGSVDGVLSGEAGDFNGGGFVGFGPELFGDFGFDASAQSMSADIAQIVGAFGSTVEYEIIIGAGDGQFAGNFGAGSFVLGIPEPSTMVLGSLALVGFAARRRG